MPYTRKTARRLGRHLTTPDELDRTNRKVVCEMERLGLWHPGLDDVNVRLVPASFSCYGWFREEGDIYIPALTGARLSDLILGYHTRLTDVLRHEWGHALADRCPDLVDRLSFHDTLGGPYQSSEPVDEYDPELHLTRYAAACPGEDFAETFHYYLRHRGRLPLRLRKKPAIRKKWRFIDGLTVR